MTDKLKEALKKAKHPGHRINFLMHPDDKPHFDEIIKAARAYSELAEKVEGLRKDVPADLKVLSNAQIVEVGAATIHNAALDAVLEILKEQNK